MNNNEMGGHSEIEDLEKTVHAAGYATADQTEMEPQSDVVVTEEEGEEGAV
ncbi:MAG: hypothetical protein JWN18_245 [Parcubacteria group bacterium]|nr:hypothetical protein [Parcubacteria group bacterium]